MCFIFLPFLWTFFDFFLQFLYLSYILKRNSQQLVEEGEIFVVQLPLNFAVFYQCAIEGHTSLFKSEAVSILLLGVPKAMDKNKVLTPSNISNYISGQSRIKDIVVTQLLSITVEEAERRIQLLGIQDIGAVAYSLKCLVAKADLGPDIRLKLSEAYRNGFLPFIAEVFLTAIKYPPKSVHKISQNEKDAITSCWAELDTIKAGTPLSSSTSTPGSESITPIPPKKEQERRMSQEEIEQLLSGTPMDSHSKESNAVCDSPNVLYISPLRQSGANEAISILLSAGITSFANFFNDVVYSGLPHFDFYEDQGLVNRLLFGNRKRITIMHSFIPVKLSSFGNIEGHVAVALDDDCFSNYWEKHITELSLHFFTTKESGGYKSSMSGELGSIFTCSAVTALSDLVLETFTVEPSDMLSIGKLMGPSSPIFVGTLPFHFSTYHFEAYLILGWQSAHVLMDRLQQLLGE